MNSSYKQEIEKALNKAEDALDNAEHDLNGGFYLATANRAYYACFYCLTALLYSKGAFAKTHQGVHARFNELFLKTNLLPQDANKDLIVLFASRQDADYDLHAIIDAEQAKDLIDKASKFVQLTKRYFETPRD